MSSFIKCSFCEKDLKNHEESTKNFILKTLSLIKKKKEEKEKLIFKGREYMNDDFKLEEILNSVATDDPIFTVSFDPSKEFISLNCVTEYLENEDINFAVNIAQGKTSIKIVV